MVYILYVVYKSGVDTKRTHLVSLCVVGCSREIYRRAPKKKTKQPAEASASQAREFGKPHVYTNPITTSQVPQFLFFFQSIFLFFLLTNDMYVHVF